MMLAVKFLILVAISSFAKSTVILMNMMASPEEQEQKASEKPDLGIPAGTEMKYYEVDVDHFSFTTSQKFKMRYYINQGYWKAGKPIFFYTGNEGSIELFVNNTGFVWEIAPQFNAMVVFAEHRFYGKSLPFGVNSYKNRTFFGYLTAEQALADYVSLINYIKSSIKGAESSPVIAFGGSYGGMLAAWIRQKYPNVIAGSIAASAPVLMFPGIETLGCEGFSMILTRSYYKMGSAQCTTKIRAAWDKIYNTTKTDLAKIFHLCSPPKDAAQLVEWLVNAITDIGMANYPYPTNFLAQLPSWPVKVFCDRLTKPADLLTGVSDAAQVYYNTSGKARCLNLTQSQSPSLDANGWNYQTCMEMVMPTCTTGKKDMFLPSPWDYKKFAANCRASYGVEPRPDWIVSQFWGKRLGNGASNILFSNGDLDPWSAGGVIRSPNPSLPTIVIRNGAHHLDLRASNPLDPKSVKDARNLEKQWISRWIKSWH